VAWPSERARLNALRRYRPADDPVVLDAQRDLRAARLEDYIARTLETAPPLTAAQRDRLATLLRAGDTQSTGGAAA
jgi:hypothetical protein